MLALSPIEPAERLRLEKRAAKGRRWFFCVAVLSIANSMAASVGSSLSFVTGLGLTYLVFVPLPEPGSDRQMLAYVLCVLASGLFAVFGDLARRSTIGFLIGMALYAADALLFVVYRQWLGLGFHLLALASMYSGYTAFRRLASPIDAALAPR